MPVPTESIFPRVPVTLIDRWKFLREIIRRWYGLPLREVDPDYRLIEQLLVPDYRLPFSVLQWWALVEELSELDSTTEGFYPLDMFQDEPLIEVEPKATALFLLEYYTRDAHSAVPWWELGNPDPSVVQYESVYSETGHSYQWGRIERATVTSLILYSLVQGMCIEGLAEEQELDVKEAAKVRSELRHDALFHLDWEGVVFAQTPDGFKGLCGWPLIGSESRTLMTIEPPEH